MKVYIINPLYTSLFSVIIFAALSSSLSFFSNDGKMYINLKYELVFGGRKVLIIDGVTISGLRSFRLLTVNEKLKLRKIKEKYDIQREKERILREAEWEKDRIQREKELQQLYAKLEADRRQREKEQQQRDAKLEADRRQREKKRQLREEEREREQRQYEKKREMDKKKQDAERAEREANAPIRQKRRTPNNIQNKPLNRGASKKIVSSAKNLNSNILL